MKDICSCGSTKLTYRGAYPLRPLHLQFIACMFYDIRMTCQEKQELMNLELFINLGDNEFHLALMVDDFAGAHALHEKMGCICYENKAMGIYFINDPDNYWIEIVPKR